MKLFEKIKKKNQTIYKILGVNIFSSHKDKEENFYTIKCLFGLINFIYDINLRCFKLKFLKCSLLKTKMKNSCRVLYFMFIPIWFQKVDKKFLNLFLDKIIQNNPEYEDYYIFPCRSGEFFLLMHHFKEYVKQNNSTNFLLVFNAKYHENIFKMFYPEMPHVLIKKINVPLISKAIKSNVFKYKNKRIFSPMNEKYFRGVENSIRENNAHYYECLKKYLNLNNEITNYTISAETQKKIYNIAKYILNDNFIFISPETLSNEPMEKDFWENLVKSLKNKGYEVFCNAMFFENLIKGTSSTFLTYEETIELSKYAKAIIGMRSGLLECLSQNNVPLFALYTDFPNRPGFKKIKSEKVLQGFSISKLPNVNLTKLFEIDVNKYDNENFLIKNILNKITKDE